MANSVNPDQTAPKGRSLFWVHAVCFYTSFVSNVKKLFAADDFIFLGALRINFFNETNNI